MRISAHFLCTVLTLPLCILIMITSPSTAQSRLERVKQQVMPSLREELAAKGMRIGEQVFLRAFKAERELEVWVRPQGQTSFQHYATYHIAGVSGGLGPKLKEGDGQMPEGFYHIHRRALNPQSRYHLSFNIGYPNAYDRYHKRTGSFIMVHGSNLSIGCYAMTDPVIEKIYLLVEAALKAGQPSIAFHTYPFRMEDGWEKRAQSSPWYSFWQELAPAYQYFQTHHSPAPVKHTKGRYSSAF